MGEGTNVVISRCIGNLKNTHIGANRRIRLQPYIRAPMYGPASDEPYVGTPMYGSSIHQRYCPYIGVWSIHRSIGYFPKVDVDIKF